MIRPLTACVTSVLLAGCQLFLGGDGSECTTAADCPASMLCARDRCVADTNDRADAGIDVDASLTPDLGVDLGPDAAPVEPMDMFVPRFDAATPGEVDAPFPDGKCFDDSASVQLGAGITYVPYGLCTRFGVLWTTDDPRGRTLHVTRTWPADGAAQVLPIAQDARISTVDGRFIAFAAPGLDDAPTPVVLDLATSTLAPTVIRPVTVSEVRRGPGLTAYVSESKVFLTPDAEAFSTFVDCSAPGTRQWGVGLSEARVAWFERALEGGPARVVIADPTTCRTRLIFPAQGDVAPDARLESAGDRWLWIAAGPGGPRVVGLAPDARARLRPVVIEGAASPAQISAQGDWLATVSYADGAWRIEALHLADNRVRDLSAGSSNHRNPLIWNGYLTWAVMTREGWGVQYAPLR